MGARAARQLDRPVPVCARRSARHAPRQMGPHRQHRVGRGAARPPELPALHRHQGRADEHEPVYGARTRHRRHHRQRHPARRDLHRDRAQDRDAAAEGAHRRHAVHPTAGGAGGPGRRGLVPRFRRGGFRDRTKHQSRRRSDRIMSLTVASVAAGAMGSGVAKRLTENGVTVLTSLAGRSAASVKRAEAAGMRAVDDAQLMQADLFLSIVPPGDSRALAARFAPHFAAANRKPVFVDCNAVSPPTMRGTGEVIAETGAKFVGAAIIGPPPRPGSANAKIYVSGPAAAAVIKLNDHGLIVRLLDGPLTTTTTQKKSYAGITKGFTALAAGMMLAATRG